MTLEKELALWKKLALLAVEFDRQLWTIEHKELFPCPPNKIYWTIRLGQLALKRDGNWDWYERIRWDSGKRVVNRVRKQRFETLEDAIDVAKKVFGEIPPHGKEMMDSR